MKKLLGILTFIAFLPSPIWASTKVFKAVAGYTKPSSQRSFNELEQLGVERAAQKAAMGLCLDSGAKDCVILSDARIIKCNDYGADLYNIVCRAEGRARGETSPAPTALHLAPGYCYKSSYDCSGERLIVSNEDSCFKNQGLSFKSSNGICTSNTF